VSPRKVDLVLEWMQAQSQPPFHYRDDVWVALAVLHPDQFAVTDDRKTPWFTLHRDMTQDARFHRGERGMFSLAPDEPDTASDDTVPGAHEPMPTSQEKEQASRTPMEQVKSWVFETLSQAGGTSKFADIVAALLEEKALTRERSCAAARPRKRKCYCIPLSVGRDAPSRAGAHKTGVTPRHCRAC